MKKMFTVVFLVFFCASFIVAQEEGVINAWINEIHYDNASTDEGEFVEVVIQNPGFYSLADFTVTLYNGSNGTVYDSNTLDNFTAGDIDPNDNTFHYYYWSLPSNGIQNGAPDGMSLDYFSVTTTVIMFISYEGTFTATDGPAIGMTSTDIGVEETSSTPIGSSVGLTGSGTQYSDFTWTNFDNAASPGSPNVSQVLPVELTTFSASIKGSTVQLSWATATEINNYGFEVQRSSTESEWTEVGFVAGNGNSNVPHEYSFTDDKVIPSGNYTYRLKQIDVDGSIEISKTIEVSFNSPLTFELSQNYPNPFNPSTTIRYSLPEASNVRLTIYNILGQEIKTLVDGFKDAGVHTINFNAESLQSGLYIYKIEAGSFNEVRKMTLLK